MYDFIEYMVVTMVVIVFNQFYAYAVSHKGVEKQSNCQTLGTVYISLGVVSFVTHEAPVIIAGFILIMMGLRLVAHALDRIDKSIFIDRYNTKK
jgi:hypothetical protein